MKVRSRGAAIFECAMLIAVVAAIGIGVALVGKRNRCNLENSDKILNPEDYPGNSESAPGQTCCGIVVPEFLSPSNGNNGRGRGRPNCILWLD